MSVTHTSVGEYKSLATLKKMCQLRGFGQPVESYGRYYVAVDPNKPSTRDNMLWFDLERRTVNCDSDYRHLTDLTKGQALMDSYNEAAILLAAEAKFADQPHTVQTRDLGNGARQVVVEWEEPDPLYEASYEPNYETY